MKYLNLAKRILGPEKQDSRLTSQLLLTFCLLMSGILSYTIESLDTMESGKLILIVGDSTITGELLPPSRSLPFSSTPTAGTHCRLAQAPTAENIDCNRKSGAALPRNVSSCLAVITVTCCRFSSGSSAPR